MSLSVTPVTPNNRQRVIDHGEVFTPPGLVNDMLDLVAHECERTDSRFLEPACGNGNFLTEVLRRRLALVDKRHKSKTQWEPNALLALACLYGIELLHDNVAECRKRLMDIICSHHLDRFGKPADPVFHAAAKCIVRCNIIPGDALKMSTVDQFPKPLVFTEWSLLPNGMIKRRRYEFQELSPPPPSSTTELFAYSSDTIRDEEGKPVFIPRKLADFPPVHYSSLGGPEGER